MVAQIVASWANGEKRADDTQLILNEYGAEWNNLFDDLLIIDDTWGYDVSPQIHKVRATFWPTITKSQAYQNYIQEDHGSCIPE